MLVKIRVWERVAVKGRLEDDPLRFQADILGDGFDHHGLGTTPARALIAAAMHWRSQEESD